MDRDNFGELIRELRKKNNLTQADLAKLLHVTTGAVSKWELGKAFPNANTQNDLCQYFGLSHDDLHHSEITIEKLNQSASTDVLTVESESLVEKKSTKKKIILVASLLIIAFGIIGVSFLRPKGSNYYTFASRESDSEFTYYYFEARYVYDEYLGEEVYERSCIYIGTYMPEVVERFKGEVYKEWVEDSSLRQDVNTLKLSFYSNEQDALNWEDAEFKVYLSRD